MNLHLVSAILIALSMPMGTAFADQKSLEFQLITKYLDARTFEAANVEDQTITQAKGFGVAVFKDGRIGTKDFILSVDKHKGAGTSFGYSTYKFEDGSITASFKQSFNPQGSHGDYKILSGTGAYAGASGSGTFDGVPNPYTGDRLYRVTLQVTAPGEMR
jgi:hypothetical protein